MLSIDSHISSCNRDVLHLKYISRYHYRRERIHLGTTPCDFHPNLNNFEEEVRMGKAMTKSQIADHLAGKAGVTKKTATEMLDNLATLAYKEAKNSFTMPGIGKLVLAHRKARTARNPQTGAPIKVPAKKVVKFRVAKAAKDAILGKK